MKENNLFVLNNLPDVLSSEETNELLVKIKQGDEFAKNILAKHNIRLVIFEVLTKFSNIYDKEELVAVGNIGLVRAINTFSLEKKVHFPTYALTCIRNEILMYLKKLKKINTEVSFEEVISANSKDDNLKIKDILCDTCNLLEDYIEKEENNNLRNIVDNLPNEVKTIIKMYYGFYGDTEYNQTEIANVTHLSQSQISRKINNTLNILKNKLKSENDNNMVRTLKKDN